MSFAFDTLNFARRITPAPLKRAIPMSWRSSFHNHLLAEQRHVFTSLNGIHELLNDMEQRPVQTYLNDQAKRETTIPIESSSPGVIEINDSCNINCLMCDTKSATRKKGVMNLDLFERSVKKLASYGYTGVELHTIGDPLANRNLADYLEVLRRHHFIVGKLSSNCLMLESHMDTLFEYRDVIRSFRASIDAAYKNTYEHIRAGGNWGTLLKNLHLFKERNEREKHPYPVYINNMISADNYEELAYIPETFKFLVNPVDVSYVFMNSNAPTDHYFQQANVLKGEHTLQRPCQRPFGGLHILKDGALTTCCRDYNGDLIYGNIMDDDLLQVINNEKIQGIRKAHLSDDYDKLPKLCQTCYTVDPRWSKIMTSIIHVYYAEPGAGPAPLQEALNNIRPMMIKRDYKGIRNFTGQLFASR